MSPQPHKIQAGIKPTFFLTLIVILSLTQTGWTRLPQAPTPPGSGLSEFFTSPTLSPARVLVTSGLQTASTSPVTIYASDAEYTREVSGTNDGFGNYLRAGLSAYSIDNRQTRLYRSALRFSLAKIPPNSTITSAVLKLTLIGASDYTNVTTREIRLYRLSSNWHQSVVTWARQPAAAEQVASVQVGKNIYNPDPDPEHFEKGEYTIQLTELVRAWYSGTAPNYGIMLAGSEGDYGSRMFASNDTTLPPKLIVEYTTTNPTLTASPAVALTADTHSSPKAGSLVVKNEGTTRLDWQLTNLPTWLAASALSGSLGPDLSEEVSLTPNLTGLTQGITYNHTIQVTSATPGVINSPTNVQVTLNYTTDAPPNIWLPLVFRTGASSSSPQKVVALIIGIREYKNIDETTPTLAGIHVDSWGTPLRTVDNLPGDMGQITLNAALYPTGPGIASMSGPVVVSGNTTVMMLRNEQAAHEDIERAFKWLDAQEDENTRVIVMYAGHGGQKTDNNGDERDGDGYDEMITTWDTDDYGQNVITDDTLNTWLGQLESKQVAVFIDACNSGGFSELADNNPNLLLMMSSRSTESSVESDNYGLSLFSYELGAALLDPTADTNKDGSVSAQEAFAYLEPKVIAEVAQFEGESQTPQMANRLSAEFPLSRP